MRILLRVLAVLIGLFGVVTLAVGLGAVVYVGSDDTVPLTSQSADGRGVALVTAPGLLSVQGPTVHVTVRSTENGRAPLFVGVAPADQTADYLKDLQRTEITGYQWPNGVSYHEVPGRTRATAPGGLDIWAAHQQGESEATLAWTMPDGAYDIVVMRADGSVLRSVDVATAIQLTGLFRTGLAVAAAGLGGLAVAVLIFVLTRRRTLTESADEVAAPVPAPTVGGVR